MSNKMGKTNHTSTTFAANILYITGNSCSKSIDIRFLTARQHSLLCRALY